MKKHIIENWRVEVYLSGPLEYGQKATQLEAEDIKRQILRHVDGLDSVVVTCDKHDVCSFCGYAWEDPPMCCDEAVKEAEAELETSNHDG